MRIKGWLGRADQTTKVKGMFVHPSQVAEVLRRHPQILKGRLVVDQREHQDVMTLHCEVSNHADAALEKAIVTSIREICKLRGAVVFVAPGSLPNDGKVIDDIRKYD
jgi:phenylacetate-CoA ligase